MPRFDKKNAVELKAFLYDGWSHDAEIERVNCDYENDSIEIVLLNPFFNIKIDLTFHNIGLALSVKGNWHGSRKTIIGITVVENDSYLGAFLPEYSEHIEGSLYLLFQMFSGDELHIVSKEVTVEKRKTGDGSLS